MSKRNVLFRMTRAHSNNFVNIDVSLNGSIELLWLACFVSFEAVQIKEI